MRSKTRIEIGKSADTKQISELYYALYSKRKRISFKLPKMKSVVLIAKRDKKPAGFILATFTSYGASKFGYLEELFVKSNSRKLGIGRGLVNRALKWLKSLDAEVVFVTTDSKGAIEFYRKLGFAKSKQAWLVYVPK